MPVCTVLEGEILQSITWTIISWNLHLSGRGQTMKWPVGIDRPAKRPVKKTEDRERWSKEGDGGQVTSGHVGQSEDLGLHILELTASGGSRLEERSPLIGLTQGHSGCWAESLTKGSRATNRKLSRKSGEIWRRLGSEEWPRWWQVVKRFWRYFGGKGRRQSLLGNQIVIGPEERKTKSLSVT